MARNASRKLVDVEPGRNGGKPCSGEEGSVVLWHRKQTSARRRVWAGLDRLDAELVSARGGAVVVVYVGEGGMIEGERKA